MPEYASQLYAIFFVLLLLFPVVGLKRSKTNKKPGKMGLFSGQNHFPVEGRTVLVTGASQGMGRSVARLLAEKGASVVIVARNTQRLEEALEHATAGAVHKSQRFHSISADLSSSAEATRVLSETTAWNNESPPDIVWCCAGSSYPSLFVDAPISTFQSQLEANYLSAAYIAHAALQLWLKPSSKASDTTSPPPPSKSLPLPRHLIFTSSPATAPTLPRNPPSAPSPTPSRKNSSSTPQHLPVQP
ncbi:MAG: hypothetical protein Q9170_006523 [Blastenia crenularia]